MERVDLKHSILRAAAYGDHAKQITRIAEEQKLGKRLVRGHPMLEAEVVYACRAEFCEHAEDFIARRTRLAFLDTAATEQALPRVRPKRPTMLLRLLNDLLMINSKIAREPWQACLHESGPCLALGATVMCAT